MTDHIQVQEKHNNDTERFKDIHSNIWVTTCIVLLPTACSFLVWDLNLNKKCPNAFIEQRAEDVPRVRHYIGVFLVLQQEYSWNI